MDLVSQVWPIAGGVMVFEIRTEKPLTYDVYAEIGRVMRSLKQLADRLASTPEGETAA